MNYVLQFRKIFVFLFVCALADGKLFAQDTTLELQAVAAYKLGAGSGKLSPAVLGVAAGFLREHEGHAQALNDTIDALGGSAVEPLKRYEFGALPGERSILALALELEQGAADAYASMATNIDNRKVLTAAAGILVDEVRHATVLRSVLGLPVITMGGDK